MRRIAQIVSTGEYSGAEKIVIEICSNLRSKYEFTYICKPGGLVKYLEDKGISYLIYNNSRELKILLRKFNFDVVHAHDYTASILAALFSKTKVISHIHNNTPFAKSANIKSILYLIASYKFEKIICVSNSIVEEMYFKNKIKNKVEIIYNWINLNERVWNEELDKNTDLLFVGRFTEQKNPMLFLEIIKELKDNNFNDISVIMIGRGELKEDINKYILENKLQNNIEVLDFTNIPHKYMSEAKVFFVPSKWEGFGLVFLEAVANGCAVVSTPVGGVKEIFKDYPMILSNDKKELMDIIIKMLNDKSYREDIIVKSRKELYRFNMKNNIEKISSYYN